MTDPLRMWLVTKDQIKELYFKITLVFFLTQSLASILKLGSKTVLFC